MLRRYNVKHRKCNKFIEYNKNEALIEHGLQVEVSMRFFAKEADEEKWGIVSLVIVQPSKSAQDLSAKSVKKKFKPGLKAKTLLSVFTEM